MSSLSRSAFRPGPKSFSAHADFLQSDASARHRDGGGSSQAVDLRDGLRGRRQPAVFLCISIVAGAAVATDLFIDIADQADLKLLGQEL